jgi:hypothetical protein
MAAAPDSFGERRALRAERGSIAAIAARLAEIAVQLERAAQDDTSEGCDSEAGEEHPAQRASALATARHAYWLRRQRAQIFGSAELFGEPAWDILLDLYIAQAEGKAVSVSSACIGSASPATTGLRWLAVLTDQGLIAREADAQDNRRIMVRLTERGITAMERFLKLAREPYA